MEILSLRYLLAVAEFGSFAAAARHLKLHTSTLSRHIFTLEEELGTTIFEREHSGVRLTSSGDRILVYARQTLADIETLNKIARNGGVGKQGHVRIGVHIPPISGSLVEMLSRWHHFHPDVELSLHELPDSNLSKAIRDRQLDAVLMAEHVLPPDFACEPIHSEHLFVAAPNHSPLSRQSSVSWAILRKELILVQDWPQSHMTRAFYGGLFGHGTCFQPHAASKQSVLALVAAGFGITLATESQAKIGFPDVSFVPISEENASINIVLAWLPQSEDPVIGRFIAFMRDEARSLRSR
jgi:DNA-binding transcriptional LysR family regulator